MPRRHRALRRRLRASCSRSSRSAEARPCVHRLDGAPQRRSFAGLEPRGSHQAPDDRARGELGPAERRVDLELGGRLAQGLHAEHRRLDRWSCRGSASRRRDRRLGPAGAPSPEARPNEAAATVSRSPASARVHPTASRTIAGRSPAVARHSATTTRGTRPARCSRAIATRSSRSRARWTRIGTPDCAASSASRATDSSGTSRGSATSTAAARASTASVAASHHRVAPSTTTIAPAPRSTRSVLSGRPATATA